MLDPRNDKTQGNHIWQPPVSAVLSGFTAYGCTTGIYAGGGVQPIGTITFRDCVLADNGVHVQLASMDTVEQSLLIHNTGNGILPTPASSPPFTSGPYQPFEMGHAYVAYDGPGTLRDSHLIGYDGTGPGSLVYGGFGAARRHVNHKMSGLTFGGGASAIPNVVLPDFTNDARPFVWGFTIRDLDGSLSRGLFPGRSLVGNHPMTHLLKTTGRTDDILAGGSNGWLSPFRWGHLQVRYYVNTTTPVLPAVDFVRHATSPWVQATVNVTDVQMRQIPVIVTQVGSNATQFTYQVDVQGTPPATPNRIDISLDDVETSDSVRVLVTNPTNTPWGPNLKVALNQGTTLDELHNNASNPTSLPPLASQNPHAPNSTSWFLASPSVIDLRLVSQADPISGGRTHRVSIIW